MKKQIVSLATGLFLGSAFTGLAAQVINLQSGQSVDLQGTTVTCNISTPNPGPGPRPGQGPGPRPAPGPVIPLPNSVNGNIVQWNGQIYRLGRGSAGQGIAVNTLNNSVLDLGGYLLEDPVAGVWNNEIYLFARGGDASAFYRTLNSTDGWRPLGGYILESPRVVTTANGIYAVARGSDKSIFYITLGNAQNWTSLGGMARDPILNVYPSADMRDFIVEVTGGDGRIYRRSIYNAWTIVQ